VFSTAETALGIENRHPGDWGEMAEQFNTVCSNIQSKPLAE